MSADRQRFAIDHLIADRIPEEIAEDLRISARTIQRWIANGVTWSQADVFATKILNAHPLTVFGPEWHDAAEADRPKRSTMDVPLDDTLFDAM